MKRPNHDQLIANRGLEFVTAQNFQWTLGDILEQKCGIRNRLDHEAVNHDLAAFIAGGIGKEFRDDGIRVCLGALRVCPRDVEATARAAIKVNSRAALSIS